MKRGYQPNIIGRLLRGARETTMPILDRVPHGPELKSSLVEGLRRRFFGLTQTVLDGVFGAVTSAQDTFDYGVYESRSSSFAPPIDLDHISTDRWSSREVGYWRVHLSNWSKFSDAEPGGYRDFLQRLFQRSDVTKLEEDLELLFRSTNDLFDDTIDRARIENSDDRRSMRQLDCIAEINDLQKILLIACNPEFIYDNIPSRTLPDGVTLERVQWEAQRKFEYFLLMRLIDQDANVVFLRQQSDLVERYFEKHLFTRTDNPPIPANVHGQRFGMHARTIHGITDHANPHAEEVPIWCVVDISPDGAHTLVHHKPKVSIAQKMALEGTKNPDHIADLLRVTLLVKDKSDLVRLTKILETALLTNGAWDQLQNSYDRRSGLHSGNGFSNANYREWKTNPRVNVRRPDGTRYNVKVELRVLLGDDFLNEKDPAHPASHAAYKRRQCRDILPRMLPRSVYPDLWHKKHGVGRSVFKY